MRIDPVFNNRMDTDVHHDVTAPSRLLSPRRRRDIWMYRGDKKETQATSSVSHFQQTRS